MSKLVLTAGVGGVPGDPMAPARRDSPAHLTSLGDWPALASPAPAGPA